MDSCIKKDVGCSYNFHSYLYIYLNYLYAYMHFKIGDNKLIFKPFNTPPTLAFAKYFPIF